MIKKFNVSTDKRYQLINITDQLEKIARESNIEEGLLIVTLPHSTAGLLLTENEPGLKEDWLDFLKKTVSGFDFSHNRIDNNADSHILAGLINQEKTLIIENNQLVRGTWQQVFLVELDGPRKREIVVLTKN